MSEDDYTADTTVEQQIKRSGAFFGRHVWLLVTMVIMAIVVVSSVATMTTGQQSLTDVQRRNGQLKGELSKATAEQQARAATDIFEALGVDRKRLIVDTAVIDSMVKIAFTWDSGLTYEGARQDLKTRFALTEDSEFLTSFMPPSRFNVDGNGKKLYYIDAVGLNSKVADGVQITVQDVKADKYTYVVMVPVEVSFDAVTPGSKNPGGVNASRTMLLYVTVDGSGALTNISGIAPHGQTRHGK